MFRRREDRYMEDVKEAVGKTETQPTETVPTVNDNDPPLFIKIERYGEMASNVEDLKIFVSGLKQGLTIMDEIENVKTDTVKTLRNLIQKFEKSLTELDNLVVKPRGISFSKKETDMVHVEDNLSDLQNQLKDLKKSLDEFK